ncbi:hypothetical protein BDR05DRAFT_967347 [Suillus weaverae]|nr:hypothetical protein BDR05DRAFT_967347 [Suillus weaverae]
MRTSPYFCQPRPGCCGLFTRYVNHLETTPISTDRSLRRLQYPPQILMSYGRPTPTTQRIRACASVAPLHDRTYSSCSHFVIMILAKVGID